MRPLFMYICRGHVGPRAKPHHCVSIPCRLALASCLSVALPFLCFATSILHLHRLSAVLQSKGDHSHTAIYRDQAHSHRAHAHLHRSARSLRSRTAHLIITTAHHTDATARVDISPASINSCHGSWEQRFHNRGRLWAANLRQDIDRQIDHHRRRVI